MRILNLTPHTVNYDDGVQVRQIHSTGVVRLNQAIQPSNRIDGLLVVISTYEGLSGLPEDLRSGDVLIVSSVVANHWPEMNRPNDVTVLVPDTGNTCKRDNDGRVISVSRFIVK